MMTKAIEISIATERDVRYHADHLNSIHKCNLCITAVLVLDYDGQKMQTRKREFADIVILVDCGCKYSRVGVGGAIS